MECHSKNVGIHKCACPTCEVPFPLTTIKALVSEEIVAAMQQQTENQQKGLFQCPFCKTNFKVRKGEARRNIQCENCGNRCCRLCLQKEHIGRCTERAKILKEFKKAGQEVIPCPYCLQFSQLLDPTACAHVTCYSCKKEFQICCGVKFPPVNFHGNQYHREGCRNYSGFDGEDKMNEKCEMCKLAGTICPRPKPLEDGDIPVDEWPAEYQ